MHLAVRVDNEVVFVERFVSPETADERPRVGGRYAMHATAVGLVLLAHAPLDLQEEVMAGPLTTFTEWTTATPRELREVLADVRRNGYAVSDRQINTKYVSVAAPIYGADNTVVAALSLIVPHAEPHGPSVGHLVQATARGISRALGSSSTMRKPS